MNIVDVKTTSDASSALTKRRARLEILQAEPDNAKWLKTQAERNQLESDIRELTQLHGRLAQQEKAAHTALLETELAEKKAILAKVDPNAEKLAEVVRDAVTAAVRLFRESAEVAAEKNNAADRAKYLVRQLGRPNESGNFNQHYGIPLHEARYQVRRTLAALDATKFVNDVTAMFSTDIKHEALADQSWWQDMMAKNKAAETADAALAEHAIEEPRQKREPIEFDPNIERRPGRSGRSDISYRAPSGELLSRDEAESQGLL